jgi:photosystem II stability/assembly factor-like uncharacterized protein
MEACGYAVCKTDRRIVGLNQCKIQFEDKREKLCQLILSSFFCLLLFLSCLSTLSFSAQFTVMGGGAGGRFSDILIDPGKPETAFLSGDNTGIWKTIDGGMSWQSLNKNGLLNYRVADLEFHPENSSIIYAATQGGAFRTMDSGTSWKSLRISEFPEVDQRYQSRYWSALSCIKVCPQNPKIIFAGCGGSTRFRPRSGLLYAGYKSKDEGNSWECIPNDNGGPDPSRSLVVSDFAWSPNDSRQVFMASNQGLYKSSDGGQHWLRLSNGLDRYPIMEIKTVPADERKLYAATATKNSGGLYFSDDGGEYFRKIGPKRFLHHKSCKGIKFIDKEGKKFFANMSSRLLYTNNGGMTWEIFGKPNHRGYLDFWRSSVLSFDVDIKNPALIYTVSDFILKTKDKCRQCESSYSTKAQNGFKNRGLVNTSTRSILVDPKDPAHIIIGELDIGISESRDNGVTWNNFHEFFRKMPNRPWECFALDCDPSGTLYALVGSRSRNISWLVKREAGKNWQAIKRFAVAEAEMDIEVATDACDIKIFITLPGTGLACWDKKADQWTVQTFGNRWPVFVTQDPVSKDTLYACCRFRRKAGKGGLFRSKNFGDTWKAISPHYPGFSDVWTIAVDPRRNNFLYAGTRGYRRAGTGGLYLSTDTGATWKRIDQSIKIANEDPGKRAKRWVRSIVFSQDGSMLCLGLSDDGYDYNMDKGIFVSRNGGQIFNKINQMPFNDINTLTADPVDPHILWAGTEGGGAWRIRLDDGAYH